MTYNEMIQQISNLYEFDSVEQMDEQVTQSDLELLKNTVNSFK